MVVEPGQEEPIAPIADLLWETATRYGDQIAVHERDRKTTYAMLADRASQIARGIAARTAPGDRVVLLVENSADFFAALWGALAAGTIAVPFVATAGMAEIVHALDVTAPSLAIVTARTAARFAAIDTTLPIAALDTLATGQSPVRPAAPPTGPDDPALIIFSSGTTGLPKGIVHTSRTLRWRCQDAWAAGHDWAGDIACCATPLPLRLMRIVPTIWVGAGFSLAEGTGIDAVLATIARDRAQTLWAVPTLLHLLLHGDPRAYDLASWQRVLSFSAYLHPAIQQQFERHFQVPVYQVYGMLEGGVAAEADTTTPLGSVGRANHGVTIEIVDAEEEILDREHEGEIRYRGPIVMAGYWGDPASTASTIRDGYLYTGDIGRYDREGNLYIVGRAKEIIKRNGFSISPALLEDVLLRHPDVTEAVVAGRPDAQRGEQVIAAVVLRAGHQTGPGELMRHVRQFLAGAYLPNAIEIRASLPKAPSGKILRRALFPEYTSPDPPGA